VALDAPVLNNAGGVSQNQAHQKATAEYEKYLRGKAESKSKIEGAYFDSLTELRGQVEDF
jgi:hypothetical protein